jgi:hypothetical protein
MIPKRAVILMLMVAGCGGSDKPAESASNASSGSGDCPAGMVKEGGDCVAPEGQGGPGKAGDMSSHGASDTSSGSSGSSGTTSTSSGGSTIASPPQQKTAYDKDAVEIVLKRAATQVKSNCGAATDENGKANGPWGATKASVRLGRNGHVRGVDVPSPYGDKPVGTCIVHAFQNLIFPPYAAPADVTVDWDVELVKPK